MIAKDVQIPEATQFFFLSLSVNGIGFGRACNKHWQQVDTCVSAASLTTQNISRKIAQNNFPNHRPREIPELSSCITSVPGVY
jgi:hypothetical protein